MEGDRRLGGRAEEEGCCQKEGRGRGGVGGCIMYILGRLFLISGCNWLQPMLDAEIFVSAQPDLRLTFVSS